MTGGTDPRWGKPDATHDPAILANFQARPTDVLITTAPKAGTTWMQQILHQARSGGDADFTSIDNVVPWLELPRPGKTVDELLASYEAIEDPRVFKTHCTYGQTPGADTARIVMTSRDPRDCCISYYHHVMDMTDEARAGMNLKMYTSFDELFDDWMQNASWFRNVAGWWPHRDAENLLWLRFEDMKADLPGAFDRIVDFLGWSITGSQRAVALEHASFDWMKRHADKFTRQLSSDKPVFKPGGFIRKGAVGEYRTRLSAAQENAILAKARETLEPDCLEYLGL